MDAQALGATLRLQARGFGSDGRVVPVTAKKFYEGVKGPRERPEASLRRGGRTSRVGLPSARPSSHARGGGETSSITPLCSSMLVRHGVEQRYKADEPARLARLGLRCRQLEDVARNKKRGADGIIPINSSRTILK